MDPILEDDLERRRKLEEEARVYLEQQMESSAIKKKLSVKTGPMAGKFVGQINCTATPKSPSYSNPKISKNRDSTQEKGQDTAEKINANFANKLFGIPK